MKENFTTDNLNNNANKANTSQPTRSGLNDDAEEGVDSQSKGADQSRPPVIALGPPATSTSTNTEKTYLFKDITTN